MADATRVIEAFPAQFEQFLLQGQRAKLGLDPQAGDTAADTQLVRDWYALLQAQAVDFTLAWRRLSDFAAGQELPLQALFADTQPLHAWLARWRERCAAEPADAQERAQRMRAVNPWLIPRNHRVEEALAAASDEDDLGPFRDLLAALQRPFEERPAHARFAEPAPAAMTACYQTFCGT